MLDSNFNSHAFLWKPGVMVDLNDLILTFPLKHTYHFVLGHSFPRPRPRSASEIFG
jgi:hypothetical protein